MSQSGFGLNVDIEASEIGQTLRALKRDINGVEFELVMRETYEHTFHIADYNQAHNQGPFGLVMRREKEEYSEGVGIYNFMARFSKHRIHEKFGLTLGEALQLPRAYTDELFKIASMGAQAKAEDDANKQMEKRLRELGIDPAMLKK